MGIFPLALKSRHAPSVFQGSSDSSRGSVQNHRLQSSDNFWEGTALGNRLEELARARRANAQASTSASSSQRSSEQSLFDVDPTAARPRSNASATTIDTFYTWAQDPISSAKSGTNSNSKENKPSSHGDTPESSSTEDHLFQLSDIPLELRLVQTSTSSPIRTVVREFWQECEAIQASARSLQDDATRRNQATQISALVEPGRSYLDGPVTFFRTPTGSTASIRSGASGFSNQRQSLRASVRNGAARILSVASVRKSTIKRKALPEAIETRECAGCFDDLASSCVDLACKHSYCTTCCSQLIKTAMQNESIWPPRCCLIDIPRATILRCLSEKEVIDFSAKEKEYGTPANERWYCTSTKCLKFFEPYKHSNWTSCTHCQYQMCLHCRGAKHKGNERCSQDRNLQATLAEADIEGWKACYKCSHIIELNNGCRHITCRCGAEFCYVCGARWRTCRCTEDDKTRKLERVQASKAEKRRKEQAEREEEAALQKAIDQIADQTRKEETRLLLEEKRQIDRFESLRISGIRSYFESARNELRALQVVQVLQIKTRHNNALANGEVELADAKIKKYRLEQAKSKQDLEEKNLKDRHESQVCEDFKRHLRAQEVLLASVATTGQETSTTALQISNLLAFQAKEREARDVEFCRQLEIVTNRQELVNAEQRYNQAIAEADSAMEDARNQLEKIREMVAADKRWIELAATERLAMLEEDEVRYIETGREAPHSPQLPDIEAEFRAPWPVAESSNMGARREALEAARVACGILPSTRRMGLIV